jgi:hypothetical protein
MPISPDTSSSVSGLTFDSGVKYLPGQNQTKVVTPNHNGSVSSPRKNRSCVARYPMYPWLSSIVRKTERIRKQIHVNPSAQCKGFQPVRDQRTWSWYRLQPCQLGFVTGSPLTLESQTSPKVWRITRKRPFEPRYRPKRCFLQPAQFSDCPRYSIPHPPLGSGTSRLKLACAPHHRYAHIPSEMINVQLTAAGFNGLRY